MDLPWDRVTLTELGRHAEAIDSYDKAIAFYPDLAEAWYNRGVALGNLGQYADAVISYDKAIEINPDYPEARENRKIALQQKK
jgi:tetratricopeptide (TPR) repeat protein